MSLNTVSDIQTEVLVRNNRTTTDSFITDAMLDDWIRDAHVWAAGYKKWPMTEGRASTTFTSLGTNEDGYLALSYFEGWKADSVRRLSIGGKRLFKKNFYKFTEFLEDNPSSVDRLFSDFARVVYINPRIDLSGTVTAWGQYTPALDPTDKTAITIFSNFDEEGNEALVERMTGYLKRREHLPDEAELHDQRAVAKLEELHVKIKDEQFGYQDTDNEGMWKRIDVVEGGYRDDLFKRNQFT